MAPMSTSSFLRKCLDRADRIEEALQGSETTTAAKGRKRPARSGGDDAAAGLKLLERAAAETKELERKCKRLREQEAQMQMVQNQAAWSEYWACAKAEELRQHLVMQKMQNDDLMRRIAAYEQRFGRHF